MKFQQNLILENGGTIWLPPNPDRINMAIPDLSKPDTVQGYDIGTAYVYNGKCFYYAYTTGTVKSRWAAKISHPQDILYRAVPTTSDIYATSIHVTTVSPNDGPSGDGTFPVDYMKGGHVTVFVNGGTPDKDDFSRGIIGSTVVTTAGKMTLELDAPIPHAVTQATAIIEAMASQYAGIDNGTLVSYPAVGVPACYAAASRWVWIQTWGACWLAPHSAVGVRGDTGVVFRHDGSLEEAYKTESEYVTTQYAGYTLAGKADDTQAAPFVYLQIAHP